VLGRVTNLNLKSKKKKKKVAINYSDNASKMGMDKRSTFMTWVEIFSMRENRVSTNQGGISSDQRQVKQVYRVTVEQHRLPETSLMLLY
jgi:hypothetical protein